MGDRRGAYRVLVGKSEAKRPLEKPRHRFDDNVKTDLKETGWECVNWSSLTQCRKKSRFIVKTVLNLRVP
jgi:hypothetical protein